MPYDDTQEQYMGSVNGASPATTDTHIQPGARHQRGDRR